MTNPLCDEFYPEYEAFARLHLREKSIRNRLSAWRRFMADFQPERLGDVTQRDVMQHQAQWKAAGKHPVSWNTFRAEMKALYNQARREVMDLAGQPVYTGHNPFEQVRPFKVSKKAISPLTLSQMDHLVTTARSHASQLNVGDIHFVFALGAYAGLRKKEIAACRWEWFDWKANRLNVVAKDGFVPKAAEGWVPIFEQLRFVLYPYRAATGYIYLPDRDTQGPLYRTDFTRSFKTVCEKANMPHVTTHLLRHSFGSLCLDMGFEIYKVSKWMRHSSINVTVDTYGHLYDEAPNNLSLAR